MKQVNPMSVLFKSLLTIAILFFSINLNANDRPVSNTEPETSIQHLGNTDAQMYFRIKYPNIEGNKFSILVKDKEGNIFFDRMYNKKNLDLKLVLPRNNSEVYFQIKDFTNGDVESFSVNTQVKVIEEVIISKL